MVSLPIVAVPAPAVAAVQVGMLMFLANPLRVGVSVCPHRPLAGLTMLGLAQGRCGWLMHEGGHLSLTGNIPVDIAIQV